MYDRCRWPGNDQAKGEQHLLEAGTGLPLKQQPHHNDG